MGIIARQWDLLNHIPNHGTPITTSELSKKWTPIHGKGTKPESFLKKIQNDINRLEKVVQHIEITKPKGASGKRETQISWMRNAPPLKMAGMSLEEILAFGVLAKFGTGLMPRRLQESFRPRCQPAKHTPRKKRFD